jgi:hypothetical protein
VSAADDSPSPLSGNTNYFLPMSDLGQCNMKVIGRNVPNGDILLCPYYYAYVEQ